MLTMLNKFVKILKKEEDTMAHEFYYKGDIVETPMGEIGKVIYINDNSITVKIDRDKSDFITAYKGDELLLISGADDGTDNLWQEYIEDSKSIGTQTTFTGLKGKGKGKKYKPGKHFLPRCNHSMDPFKLNEDMTIYLSGRGTTVKKDSVVPTAGCYMDSGWMKGTFWMTPNQTGEYIDGLFPDTSVDTLYLNWRDMGVIPVYDFSVAIVWCVTRMMEGENLEIGCYGSHGRTGTLLAGVLVYLGATAEEAIKEVRTKHCDRAIETKGQEELIAKYEESLRKEETINEGS